MCIFLLCLSKSTDVLTIFVASVRLSAGDSILDLMKSIIGMFLFVKYRFEISSRPRSPVKTRCPVCYITLCCCSLSRYNIFILAAHLSDIVTARSWMHFRPDYSVTYANKMYWALVSTAAWITTSVTIILWNGGTWPRFMKSFVTDVGRHLMPYWLKSKILTTG